jgi:hypothetical protein
MQICLCHIIVHPSAQDSVSEAYTDWSLSSDNLRWWIEPTPRISCILNAGLFKKKYTLQKIFQVLLIIWWCAIYRLKGKLWKLFSHLTSTRYEPHMWHGRCQIDNSALPTLVAACHR